MLKMFFAGFALLGLPPLAHAAFVVDLPDTRIQGVLQNYFPISEYAAFARVSMDVPQVRLSKTNKDIVLVIPIEAKVMGGGVHKGHVTMLLGLSYKPARGGLFFGQPRITQFEIPSVSEKMLAELREIVDVMGKNALPLVRIYTVKERDLNHSLAKSELKSFVIGDGRLQLEFGFN
ncbi:MAG TPA: DUF1439 domain-containing protein [Gammaproteobacteria bacterium]|nr:DUF1439 domain-containing protein [Gammaproteobacteria bacterium]